MTCQITEKTEEKKEKLKRVIDDNSYPEMMLVALERLTKYPYIKKKEINNNFDWWFNLYEKGIRIYNIKVDMDVG